MKQHPAPKFHRWYSHVFNPQITAPDYWAAPLAWERKSAQRQADFHNRWEGTLRETFRPETIPASPPLPRVLVGGSFDLFDRAVAPAHVARILDLVRSTPHVIWLFVTKRPDADRLVENVVDACFPDDNSNDLYDWASGWIHGYALASNLWLGVSASDQEALDGGLAALAACPSSKRFLHIPELRTPLCFRPSCSVHDVLRHVLVDKLQNLTEPTLLSSLSWVIVQGSTEPIHPDWVRGIHRQCDALRVPLFFAGWGDWVPTQRPDGLSHVHTWADGVRCAKVGRARSGQKLDGKLIAACPPNLKVHETISS